MWCVLVGSTHWPGHCSMTSVQFGSLSLVGQEHGYLLVPFQQRSSSVLSGFGCDSCLWGKYFWNINNHRIHLTQKIISYNYILNWGNPTYLDCCQLTQGHLRYLQISNTAHDPLPFVKSVWISGPSLSLLEQFECSLDLPNTTFNLLELKRVNYEHTDNMIYYYKLSCKTMKQ